MDLESIPGAISRLRALKAHHSKHSHYDQEMYHLLKSGLEKLAKIYIGKGKFRVSFNVEMSAYRLVCIEQSNIGPCLAALISNRNLSFRLKDAPRRVVCSARINEVYIPESEVESLVLDFLKLQVFLQVQG